MKTQILPILIVLILISCKNRLQNQIEGVENSKWNKISKTEEKNYSLVNDSLVFKSGTIENFDVRGNSIDVYWVNKDMDTILKFYNRYDSDYNLIGAEYYEEDEVIPSRDTIYYTAEGLKVVASLNEDNRITWSYTTVNDKNGNPVLKLYENGNGEYRGLDSLYFDKQNRVVRGFYENAQGRRFGIKTYSYLVSDKMGNWTERIMYVNDTLKEKHFRKISYHNTKK